MISFSVIGNIFFLSQPQSAAVLLQNVRTFSVVGAAEDTGEVLGQQEECSQKLLHSHHGLREMLQVHVCHLGRLGASDAIMVLDLKTHQ